jgi:hypothetical protein
MVRLEPTFPQPHPSCRLRLQNQAAGERVHYLDLGVTLSVIQILGVNGVSSQRSRRGENGGITIGGPVASRQLNRDAHHAVVNRDARNC